MIETLVGVVVGGLITAATAGWTQVRALRATTRARLLVELLDLQISPHSPRPGQAQLDRLAGGVDSVRLQAASLGKREYQVASELANALAVLRVGGHQRTPFSDELEEGLDVAEKQYEQCRQDLLLRLATNRVWR